LDDITAAIGAITDLNAQIATASEQQSAVAEEINRNINNISTISQTTKDCSDKTESAAQDLARYAADMKRLAGKFRV
jgi:methyl-accepting chemotaxis protein